MRWWGARARDRAHVLTDAQVVGIRRLSSTCTAVAAVEHVGRSRLNSGAAFAAVEKSMAQIHQEQFEPVEAYNAHT
eukprot:6197479-Pleurochrysis_carterae.AAC.2